MAFEILEPRRLHAVTVVEGYPGYFEIYGTDAPDVIAISVSAADSSFTLGGVTYAGTAYLSVFAYDGDDTVSIAIDGSSPIGASVVAGGGNDTVSVTGSGAVWGDGGDDVITLVNSHRGEAYGGPGDDKITISGDCPDATIEGEQGADLINASACNYGVFAHGGQGGDTIFGSGYDDRLYGDSGNDFLVGNGGNDVFFAADAHHDRIVGGAGIDVAFIDFEESGVWSVEYVFYV